MTPTSGGERPHAGSHLLHRTPRRPSVQVVDASPRPYPDGTAHALVQMTPQEIEALTATRQVDHPRLLRMQLQPVSASSTWQPPRAPRTRRVSSACVALRFGRNPYDEARKSASKMGLNTSVAAICATRSRTVGIPSGRRRPSALGMYRRRTSCGRYVPARSAVPSSSMNASTPRCSISASVSESTARRAHDSA